MPTKNKAIQAAAARRHYESNKTVVKARAQAWKKEQSRKLRELVRELKNVPCTVCGVEYPGEPYLMDFDHQRGDKDMTISMAVNRGWSEKRLLNEIEKCEVVCVICHRRRTYGGSDVIDV